jgi:hypothetical protein
MYIGLDISDRAYYREIVAGRDWNVSEFILGRANDKPGFSINRAIRNEQGELLGIVAASFVPSGLDGVLEIHRSEGAGVSLVDHKGMHVHRYPATEHSWEQRNWLKLYPLLEKCTQRERGYRDRRIRAELEPSIWRRSVVRRPRPRGHSFRKGLPRRWISLFSDRRSK